MSKTGNWIIEQEELYGANQQTWEPPCIPEGPSAFGHESCHDCDQCPNGGGFNTK